MWDFPNLILTHVIMCIIESNGIHPNKYVVMQVMACSYIRKYICEVPAGGEIR